MIKQKFIVDTNVLLRYLLADDDIQSPLVKRYFLSDKFQLFIPTITLCESVWVMKKRAKISNDLIVDIIVSLIAQNNIIVDEPPTKFGLDFLRMGGDFADGVIAYQVSQYKNASLLTFDQKAQSIAKQLAITCIEP